MAKRAVVFDLFDTLVSGGTERRDALVTDMAADLGAEPGKLIAAFRASYRERFAGTTGTVAETIAELARRCGVEPAPAAVAAAERRRLDYTRELLTPFQGVEDVLSTLVERGWRLGLITNCSEETRRLWPRGRLARYFATAVFSCEVGLCKPDPAIYRLAAGRLGAEPDQCVYVADGAGGELGGADSVGMSTIRVEAVGVDHATFGGFDDWNGPVIADLTRLPEQLPKPVR